MTPEQIRLVTDSLARVRPDLPAVSSAFYGRLFEDSPALRARFPADLDQQVLKFAANLDALVSAVPDFAAFTERAAQLGRAHAARRTSAADYAAVGRCLLDALGAADPQWDAATAEAWGTAYDLVAESMLLAGRSAGRAAGVR